MYRNLQAEQARFNMTNQDVADVMEISRATYESKKKTGRFNVNDCKKLCKLFRSSFEYLFATE